MNKVLPNILALPIDAVTRFDAESHATPQVNRDTATTPEQVKALLENLKQLGAQNNPSKRGILYPDKQRVTNGA
ncbi:MAG TPA: hypothetical protein G4N94_11975 [Caldilineae bacterium]|nr:hypothetical protein [Caldilineae bacterium]